MKKNINFNKFEKFEHDKIAITLGFIRPTSESVSKEKRVDLAFRLRFCRLRLSKGKIFDENLFVSPSRLRSDSSATVANSAWNS